jgi:hypothetical protein
MIGDLKRRILAKFEADTDDLESGLDRVKGRTRETQKGFLDWGKGLTDTLNKGVDWLGKFNLAFDGARKIIDFASESLKAFTGHSRMMAAAGSADIARLSKAAGGLRNETDLLTFAAKAQHGAIALSQQQMETAEKAMRMLTRAGFDQEDVTKKVTDAIVKLEGDGLKDFGIRVQKGKTDLETFNNLMGELAKKAQGADSATLDTAESVTKMNVTFQDAMAKMREAVGQLVVSLLPLVQAVADITKDVGTLLANHPDLLKGGGGGFFALGDASGGLAGGGVPGRDSLAAIGDYLNDAFNTSSGTLPQSNRFKDMRFELAKRGQQYNRDAESEGTRNIIEQLGAPALLFGKAMSSKEFDAALGDFVAHAKEQYQKAREASNQLAEERRKLADKVAKDLTDDLVERLQGEVDAENKNIGGLGAKAGMQADNFAAIIAQTQKDAERYDSERYDAFQASRPKNFLEQMGLDDPSKIDLARTAIQGFSTSYVQAMTAIATSSEGTAAAFKKGLGMIVAGVGQKLFAFAAAEFVEAGAAAITLNFPGAAMHAGAGALLTAGGFAAMRAASALGYGGSSGSAPSPSAASVSGGGASSSPSSSAGGGGGSTGGSGQGGTTQTIIVYGENFFSSSNRMRQLDAERFVQKAVGGTYAEHS